MNEMEEFKVVVWADDDPHNAIEMEVKPMSGPDIELAATLLGCEPEQVNLCRHGEMDFYGVALKS